MIEEKIQALMDEIEKSKGTAIIATETGIGIVGEYANILSIYSVIARQLLENGIDEEGIRFAVDLGLRSEEEIYKKVSELAYGSIGYEKSE